jgi:hypothetical protein
MLTVITNEISKGVIILKQIIIIKSSMSQFGLNSSPVVMVVELHVSVMDYLH